MFGETQPKYSHPDGRDGMFAENTGLYKEMRRTEKRTRVVIGTPQGGSKGT